jgi:DNA-binding protein HU-beta
MPPAQAFVGPSASSRRILSEARVRTPVGLDSTSVGAVLKACAISVGSLPGACSSATKAFEARKEAGVPKSEAQRHFEAFEEVVTEALKAGEEVQITGFGKFSVRERKAREVRNPQTGQKMKIAAQKVPSFSAGNALKVAV